MNVDKKVFAGIYKSKGDSYDDAVFAILYNNSLCFLEDDISHIFTDVEHGIHGMELVPGYCLAVVKGKQGQPDQWQIRHSGKKHTSEYIIKTGTISDWDCMCKSLEMFYTVLS